MILQKNYQAPETHFMCDICREAVINPICPFCLTTEIEVWLTFYPDLREDIMPTLHDYLKKISNRLTSYGTRCIKCKNRRAFVCPYCFTEFVFEELKRIHASKMILREFFKFFNFDFHHTGYTKEAEKMGVI